MFRVGTRMKETSELWTVKLRVYWFLTVAVFTVFVSISLYTQEQENYWNIWHSPWYSCPNTVHLSINSSGYMTLPCGTPFDLGYTCYRDPPLDNDHYHIHLTTKRYTKLIRQVSYQTMPQFIKLSDWQCPMLFRDLKVFRRLFTAGRYCWLMEETHKCLCDAY